MVSRVGIEQVRPSGVVMVKPRAVGPWGGGGLTPEKTNFLASATHTSGYIPYVCMSQLGSIVGRHLVDSWSIATSIDGR
jgi:hypothetical protein